MTTLIDNGLWTIQKYLMERYGVDASYREIDPLRWYVDTGRASADFIKRVFNAKSFMIASKLHEGGSYDEVIQRIKDYIYREK